MTKQRILVTGGAGYVGSVLVPKLLKEEYEVRVLDSMLFGSHGLNSVRGKIELVEGDIRNEEIVRESLKGIDSVIHLAAIANDPCGNLSPEITRQVNLEASSMLSKCAKRQGVRRFIYASSSSVYGIREEPEVSEDLEIRPITIYSQTKAEAEKIILERQSNDFCPVCIRSATICGYSPRQRLDLIVNILASDAILSGELTINGGDQKRPNVNIQDITNLYAELLSSPIEKVSGQIFNYGQENHTVKELGELVKKVIGEHVNIKYNPKTSDSRSYHISSDKIMRAIGAQTKSTIEDAITDLKNAFADGLIPNPKSSVYRNIERMKELNID